MQISMQECEPMEVESKPVEKMEESSSDADKEPKKEE